MLVSRRTRLSVLAAAASGALVVTMTGTALAADHHDRPDCADFDIREAQAALDAVAPTDQIRLDNLCDLLPVRHTGDTDEPDDDAPDTTPAAVPDEESTEAADNDGDNSDNDNSDDDNSDDDGDSDSDDSADEDDSDENAEDNADAVGSGGDRDCADFASQADAQAVLAADPDDPERLDADDDGIACESHFGTGGQQVAVYPKGGVATGGAVLS